MDDRRRDRRLLALIFLGALILRLAHVYFVSGSLFFGSPIIDERHNVEAALHIADGHWLDHGKAFWKPPLYSYVLAGIFRTAGGLDLWLPRLLQALLDAVTCALAFLIARELFDRRIALASAIAVALNGPLIYFTGELVSASLAVFLMTALVLVLVRAGKAPRAWKWVAAGALLGVAVTNRAELLLLIPVAAAYAAVVDSGSRARRAVAAAAVALAACAVVTPVALHNSHYSDGLFVPVSTNGGINLWVGTDPDYGGMVGARPGPEWEALVRLPEKIGVTGDAALSRYYVRRSLDYAVDHPAAYLAHVGRKLLLFWHGYEPPSNFDLYRFRHYSPVLATLLYRSPLLYFPFGVLAPLSLLGLVVCWRRRGTRLVAAVVGVHLATAALFFVTARFRAPVVPLLSIYAVAGFAWLYRVAREDRRRALWVGAAVAGALLFCNSGLPFRAARARYERLMLAEEHHFRGTILYENYRDRNAAAADQFRQALAIRPMASTYLGYAKASFAVGRVHDTAAALVQASVRAAADPGDAHFEPTINQAIDRLAKLRLPALADDQEMLDAYLCFAWHDWGCALPGLEHAIATARDPEQRAAYQDVLARAVTGQGIDQLRRFHYKKARALLERAESMRPDDLALRASLGLLYHRLGLRDQARAEFTAFRELDRPRGAFFHDAGSQDNLLPEERGGLVISVVMAYLSYFPDDPDARAAQRAIRTCTPEQLEYKTCLYWSLERGTTSRR